MAGRAAEHPRHRARWDYWQVTEKDNLTAPSDVVSKEPHTYESPWGA
jgi:hypothetical protein